MYYYQYYITSLLSILLSGVRETIGKSVITTHKNDNLNLEERDQHSYGRKIVLQMNS